MGALGGGSISYARNTPVHLKPSDLRPTPCTLHPTPCTLTPHPHTPHQALQKKFATSSFYQGLLQHEPSALKALIRSAADQLRDAGGGKAAGSPPAVSPPPGQGGGQGEAAAPGEGAGVACGAAL
jgi:hypothetical protein